MLIDRLLPDYDLCMRHQVAVRARPGAVYRTVREVDLARSRAIRWLFALRGLPSVTITLASLTEAGFVELGEVPGAELVLGIVGRFWTPSGHLRRLDADAFRAFDTPGYAKAVWNFSVAGDPSGRTWLSTETRVHCLDAASRRRFRLYWAVVGPFSGWVRREAVRLMRERAEALPPADGGALDAIGD